MDDSMAMDEDLPEIMNDMPELQGQMEMEGSPKYDQEWVRFLDRLVQDATLGYLVDYIKSAKLTRRAKKVIMLHASFCLDIENAVTKINNYEDYMRVLDKKKIVEADLPVGLTRFDVTPDFLHILGEISYKWELKIRRSFGGFERGIIATQRHETVTELKQPPVPSVPPESRSWVSKIFRR